MEEYCSCVKGPLTEDFKLLLGKFNVNLTGNEFESVQNYYSKITLDDFFKFNDDISVDPILSITNTPDITQDKKHSMDNYIEQELSPLKTNVLKEQLISEMICHNCSRRDDLTKESPILSDIIKQHDKDGTNFILTNTVDKMNNVEITCGSTEVQLNQTFHNHNDFISNQIELKTEGNDAQITERTCVLKQTQKVIACNQSLSTNSFSNELCNGESNVKLLYEGDALRINETISDEITLQNNMNSVDYDRVFQEHNYKEIEIKCEISTHETYAKNHKNDPLMDIESINYSKTSPDHKATDEEQFTQKNVGHQMQNVKLSTDDIDAEGFCQKYNVANTKIKIFENLCLIDKQLESKTNTSPINTTGTLNSNISSNSLSPLKEVNRFNIDDSILNINTQDAGATLQNSEFIIDNKEQSIEALVEAHHIKNNEDLSPKKVNNVKRRGSVKNNRFSKQPYRAKSTRKNKRENIDQHNIIIQDQSHREIEEDITDILKEADSINYSQISLSDQITQNNVEISTEGNDIPIFDQQISEYTWRQSKIQTETLNDTKIMNTNISSDSLSLLKEVNQFKIDDSIVNRNSLYDDSTIKSSVVIIDKKELNIKSLVDDANIETNQLIADDIHANEDVTPGKVRNVKGRGSAKKSRSNKQLFNTRSTRKNKGENIIHNNIIIQEQIHGETEPCVTDIIMRRNDVLIDTESINYSQISLDCKEIGNPLTQHYVEISTEGIDVNEYCETNNDFNDTKVQIFENKDEYYQQSITQTESINDTKMMNANISSNLLSPLKGVNKLNIEHLILSTNTQDDDSSSQNIVPYVDIKEPSSKSLIDVSNIETNEIVTDDIHTNEDVLPGKVRNVKGRGSVKKNRSNQQPYSTRSTRRTKTEKNIHHSIIIQGRGQTEFETVGMVVDIASEGIDAETYVETISDFTDTKIQIFKNQDEDGHDTLSPFKGVNKLNINDFISSTNPEDDKNTVQNNVLINKDLSIKSLIYVGTIENNEVAADEVLANELVSHGNVQTKKGRHSLKRNRINKQLYNTRSTRKNSRETSINHRKLIQEQSLKETEVDTTGVLSSFSKTTLDDEVDCSTLQNSVHETENISMPAEHICVKDGEENNALVGSKIEIIENREEASKPIHINVQVKNSKALDNNKLANSLSKEVNKDVMSLNDLDYCKNNDLIVGVNHVDHDESLEKVHIVKERRNLRRSQPKQQLHITRNNKNKQEIIKVSTKDISMSSVNNPECNGRSLRTRKNTFMPDNPNMVKQKMQASQLDIKDISSNMNHNKRNIISNSSNKRNTFTSDNSININQEIFENKIDASNNTVGNNEIQLNNKKHKTKSSRKKINAKASLFEYNFTKTRNPLDNTESLTKLFNENIIETYNTPAITRSLKRKALEEMNLKTLKVNVKDIVSPKKRRQSSY